MKLDELDDYFNSRLTGREIEYTTCRGGEKTIFLMGRVFRLNVPDQIFIVTHDVNGKYIGGHVAYLVDDELYIPPLSNLSYPCPYGCNVCIPRRFAWTPKMFAENFWATEFTLSLLDAIFYYRGDYHRNDDDAFTSLGSVDDYIEFMLLHHTKLQKTPGFNTT